MIALRILVAEDNLVNQRIIEFYLKPTGATVSMVANGREALETILEAEARGEPYAMLLTDMQMPEMDGYTLATTLRAGGHTLPIIALTAHVLALERQRCIDAGCSDYVTKPIDREELLETCRRWSSVAQRQ